MGVAWEFRGYDREQVQRFFLDYYDLDNSFTPTGEDGAVRALIRGSHSEAFCQSAASISTPFRFVAKASQFYTVLSCGAGAVRLEGAGEGFWLTAGTVACLSSGTPIDATCLKSVSTVATRLPAERVRAIGSAWLGAEMDEAPRFAPTPFSPALVAQWAPVAAAVELLHAGGAEAERAVAALQDYAVTLLLCGHPHTYTRHRARAEPLGARRAAEARAFVREHAGTDLTPATVAAFLNCPLPALARGFREHFGMSLRECIFAARLARAQGTAASDLDLLRGAGFIPLLPAPAETRSAPETKGGEPGRLGGDKIERLRLHILASLSKPVRIEELAALVGLGETRFRVLFKKTFGISPAQFVLQERVNCARYLLANSGKSIASVAAETGFSSQAHLTVAFKRFAGATPGELRMGGKKRHFIATASVG